MAINMIQDSQVYLADELNQTNKRAKPTNAVENDDITNHNLKAKIEVADILPQAINASDEAAKDKEESDNSIDEDIALESRKISEAMKTISEFISMPIRTVNFTQDDGSQRTVIKIYDSENDELIKQFPSDEILSIAQRIVELQQDVSKKTGILLDENV